MSIASLQEARLREDMELGRHSPRAAVAGRFGQLAIRGERPGERELQNPDLAQNNMLEAHESSLGDIQEDLPASEPADTHAVFDVDMQPQPGSPPTSTDRLSTPPATSPKKKRTPSRKPTVRASPSKNRKKRFSPPPPRSSLEDPFTWHDYEITGHDPSDPTDDGYGINGVGFKPTAAMAWARSQKRQKQVLEWKNREAREAREKRRERRDDGVNLDPIHSIRQGSIQKRVKFDV
ncbi:hypothetical protein N7470_002488 [Penicillium chermesinum]|nr:hypothetical protein N7470_002488 [Penicillium chermesinum]